MAGVALKAFPFLDSAQTESYMATPLVAEQRVKPISHVCAALQLRCPLFIPDKTKAGGCRLFKTGTQFGGGKLSWLCFNRDEWEIPNTELYFTGVWEVGGQSEQRVNKAQ